MILISLIRQPEYVPASVVEGLSEFINAEHHLHFTGYNALVSDDKKHVKL